jgi:hypothetical protein
MNGKKPVVVLLVIGWLLGGSIFGVSLGSQPFPADPDRTFGIVEGYWRPEAAKELGVRWDRITFDWSRIQPNGPGDFDLDQVRREWLLYDIENDCEVVGLIINTPVWAASSGLRSAVPDGLYRPFDSPENYWAIFVRQLIETYAPLGVHRWIIWNKPDIRPGDPGEPHTFDGTARDYYRLVKVAYAVSHAVDEEAEIFVGGLVWWNDIALGRGNFFLQFLDSALRDDTAAANDYYFDGIALNVTINPTPVNGFNSTTDSAGDIASTVRQQLNEAGLPNKRLWITELNAVPTLDEAGGWLGGATSISLEQQADFIVQASAMAMAAGVERIAVYKLFDANFVAGETIPFGLIRADNSRRPAFEAYRYAIKTFALTETVSAGRSANARLMVLSQAERTVFVMWSAGTQAVNFWVEARFGDELRLTDSLGKELPRPRQGVGPNNVTVYVVETPPARVEVSGVVLVSGAPRVLILDTVERRSVWASLGDPTGIKLR